MENILFLEANGENRVRKWIKVYKSPCSPPYTASDRKLEAGKAWERDRLACLCVHDS